MGHQLVAGPFSRPALPETGIVPPFHLDSAALPFVDHVPHVVFDAVGGAVLGALVVAVYLWFLRGMEFAQREDSADARLEARSTTGRNEEQ